MLNATQSVSYGRGTTAPLNVVLKNLRPTGIRADVVFSTPGGAAVSSASIDQEFCAILDAVASSAEGTSELAPSRPTKSSKPKQKPASNMQ
jgi:hypothetical protein